MARFFHITPLRRLQSIVNSGGLKPPVFLSKKRDLDEWIGSAMIDFYKTGRGGSLAILEVDIPSSWVEEDEADVGPEFIVDRVIPISRIKSTRRIPIVDVKDTPRDFYYVTKSERRRTPKWRSRKKRYFATQ